MSEQKEENSPVNRLEELKKLCDNRETQISNIKFHLMLLEEELKGLQKLFLEEHEYGKNA